MQIPITHTIPIHCPNSPRYNIPIFGPLYRAADLVGIPIRIIEAVREPYYFELAPGAGLIEVETIPEAIDLLRGA